MALLQSVVLYQFRVIYEGEMLFRKKHEKKPRSALVKIPNDLEFENFQSFSSYDPCGT